MQAGGGDTKLIVFIIRHTWQGGISPVASPLKTGRLFDLLAGTQVDRTKHTR